MSRRPSTTTGAHRSGWTDAMRTVFLRAANAAGWNAEQRYMAMLYAGCPRTTTLGNPSVKHECNTTRQWQACMAIAESHAEQQQRGHLVPRPQNADSWYDVAREAVVAEAALLRRIEAEAVALAPDKFSPGFALGCAQRMAHGSPAWLTGGVEPASLDELDQGLMYRTIEFVKAWVQRELGARGLTPTTFRAYSPRTATRTHRSAS